MSNTVEHSLLHSYQRNLAMALPRLVSCVDQSVIQKQQRGLNFLSALYKYMFNFARTYPTFIVFTI